MRTKLSHGAVIGHKYGMHSIRHYINIIEDLSVGSAIELSEIPQALRDLPVIGHGATSVALKKSDDRVLLLTRDQVKADWLSSQGLGVRTGEFRSTNPRVRAFGKLPIHMFEMPLLRPLDGTNIEIVADLVAQVKAAKTAAWSANKKRQSGVEEKAIVAHFTADERHRLFPVFRFLKSKSWISYDLDLEPENFMQTGEGEIVVVDPVISRSLQSMLFRYAPPN
jgi:hypothetical protein